MATVFSFLKPQVKGVLPANEFAGYAAVPGMNELMQRLDAFHHSRGRRRFAYACLTFDSAVNIVLTLAASSAAADVEVWRQVSKLRDQLFDFVQNAENSKWQGALDKMAQEGKAKALDNHYATEIQSFGDITQDYYLMYNHGGATGAAVNAARAGTLGATTGLNPVNVANAAQQVLPNDRTPKDAQGVPQGAFQLTRVLKRMDPGNYSAGEIYMRKRMREVFHIYFKDDGLAYRADGVLFTTERAERNAGVWVAERQKFIWAMAADPKLKHAFYCAPTSLKGNAAGGAGYYGLNLGDKDMQHPSFLKGRPVICAGNCEFSNGALKSIDNGSGHYKPRPSDLLRAIEVLTKDLKIKLDVWDAFGPRVNFWAWAGAFRDDRTPDPGGKGPIVCYSIREFLAARQRQNVLPTEVIFSDTNIKKPAAVLADRTWWTGWAAATNFQNSWR